MTIKHCKKLSLVIAAASGIGLILCGPLKAQETHNSILGQSGRICKDYNAFSYIVQENGTMDFGVSFWFESGANCGLTGNAKPTNTGWRYETEDCILDIKIEGSAVRFETDEDKNCQSACGAQASLQGMSLPLAYEEGRSIKPDDLSPETFFNAPCKTTVQP